MRLFCLSAQVGISAMAVAGNTFSNVAPSSSALVSAALALMVVATGQYSGARLDLHPGRLVVRNLVLEREIGGAW